LVSAAGARSLARVVGSFPRHPVCRRHRLSRLSAPNSGLAESPESDSSGGSLIGDRGPFSCQMSPGALFTIPHTPAIAAPARKASLCRNRELFPAIGDHGAWPSTFLGYHGASRCLEHSRSPTNRVRWPSWRRARLSISPRAPNCRRRGPGFGATGLFGACLLTMSRTASIRASKTTPAYLARPARTMRLAII
jgi:hypothetical protein